jgi:phage major head subunit gpT-like protein
MPSTTARNVYGWIAEMSGMRLWDGERQVDDVVARDYELPNQDYEKTIGLGRNKVQDDQYGFFSKIVDMMGMQAKLWPDDLCVDALVNGITSTIYDGQNFFDAAHPVDMDDPSKGTYRNRYDSSTSGGGVGYPLTVDNYGFARAQMMLTKGESGRPLQVIGDTLVVPPVLEKLGLQIANAQLTAQGIRNAAGTDVVAGAAIQNVFYGTAKVVVCPRLSDQNTWYLLCTSRGIKPIIWQMRQAPMFVFKNAPTDDNMFFDKRLIYGVDGRGAAGYSLPFLAFRMST